MNLSELIINKDQIVPFLMCAILTVVLHQYLSNKFKITIELPVSIFITYIVFIIVYRIVNTNTEFSKPLVSYILQKKNFREEPYQINYINPFVTNLDKVDFNMKRTTNKKYIKRKLNELLMRKYVNFENVLAYNKDPWETVTLTSDNSGNYSEIKNAPKAIKKNKYCMNYLDENKNDKKCLILYRKHILKFVNKLYFIFERKNKPDSEYRLFECISKITISPTSTKNAKDYYTIIDTRDLHYDRQYVVFVDFPSNGTTNQWIIPPTDNDYASDTYFKKYNKFNNTPSQYYWQNDTNLYQLYVIDIYFIYNDMVILDENRNLKNDGSDSSASADLSLNKYYDKKDWIKKRYYNFIKYQFNNRLSPSKLTVTIDDSINDVSTVKFRNILGNNTKKKADRKETIQIYINKKNDDGKYSNELKLDVNGDGIDDIIINFEDYIKEHIQKTEVEANELVMVKDKNTKFDKDNDLVVDKNTVSYISFNFLNIKNITEYKNKMAYIANSIMEKYFPEELKSIDTIKYNTETLNIIQLDNLFRYNRGRQRLVLNNRVITPNNIGTFFKDIKKLRRSYIAFLDKTLQYREKINTMVKNKSYNLNVSNNELLKVLNTNVFNTKSKFLALIYKIESTKNIGTDAAGTSAKNLTKLHILQKPNGYRKPRSTAHFVKFNQIMNINGFNINPNNIYILHRTQLSTTLKPEAFYLEEYLLEPDISGNETKVSPPASAKNLLQNLKLYDCTSMFRKETIGVCNVIKILDNNRFTVSFDNVPLEFKSLLGGDTTVNTNNMFIDRPIFVMLNFTKSRSINEISHKIYENTFYKVIKVRSTTSSNSAELTLYSNYTLDNVSDIDDSDDADSQNFIYKDILVSQYINSKDFIENVYFKKIDIKNQDRLLSDGPSFKFEVALKKQIIKINPPIYRNDIIDDYETTMLKIVDYIYENEAKKIHYEIPSNIGIFKDTSSAVYSYKYKNDLYISYDKRNNPINYFKNTNSQYLCKKVYKGENFTLNINALYNLDSYQEYYKYFKNLFKNILGLHSEINYQCEEYYKSGSMLTNLRLPITFNKYVTFNTNFMLYYKKDQLLDDLDPSLLGKHVVINNNVLDNQMLNTGNSNRRNSIIYKRFMKDIIYTHKIGRKGFEYDDAKKICERIYTIYDKTCSEPTYKIQGEDYNIDYYKKNKKRDECFNIVYNDDKNLNNEEFIAKIKGFDPTASKEDMNNLDKNAYYKILVANRKTQDYGNDATQTLTLNLESIIVSPPLLTAAGETFNIKYKKFESDINKYKINLGDDEKVAPIILEKSNKTFIGYIKSYEKIPTASPTKIKITLSNLDDISSKIDNSGKVIKSTIEASGPKPAKSFNNNINFRFLSGSIDVSEIKDTLRENKWLDEPDAIKKYREEVKKLEKIGNIDVRPQRLAHLNEVKTAAYYTADWDNIAWINDENPQLHNKSNLIKVQDKKVLWFDKDDENAINKGVVCYGRKLDQNKLAQNQKNEIYNFQMEKIEQSMNDIQNYENVSKFNKQVYSRWNL